MKRTDHSADKRLNPFSSEMIRRQVDAIVHSVSFRNAPALQRLLQYVTFVTIEGRHEQLKEYTIGVEAFGRGQDYDPKIDTVVRVEMHRLRQKLKEYYKAEGASDLIVLDIPKGHYYPSFTSRGSSIPGAQDGERSSETQTPAADVTSLPKQRSEAGPGPSRPVFSSPLVVALAAIALLVLGTLIGALWVRIEVGSRNHGSDLHADSLRSSRPDVVREFWRNFIGDDTRPVVGFAQAVFLIDRTNDLLRFRHGASDNRGATVDPHLAQRFASNPALVARAGPLYYESGYTGVGDLEGIARLTESLTQIGYQVTVKRCRLVSVDDLRSHNVILLGSSFQNDAVSELPEVGDFVYKSPSLGDELWNGRIVDLHPRPGEAVSYRTERDPVTGVVKADYGLVTVEPGITPGHYIANLGALDTSGVSGVALFMTSDAGIGELMARLHSLGVKRGQAAPPMFQALLKVDLEDGLDVLRVRLVAVRLLAPNNK